MIRTALRCMFFFLFFKFDFLENLFLSTSLWQVMWYTRRSITSTPPDLTSWEFSCHFKNFHWQALIISCNPGILHKLLSWYVKIFLILEGSCNPEKRELGGLTEWNAPIRRSWVLVPVCYVLGQVALFPLASLHLGVIAYRLETQNMPREIFGYHFFESLSIGKLKGQVVCKNPHPGWNGEGVFFFFFFFFF